VAAVSRRLKQREPDAEDREVIELLERHGFFTPAELPGKDQWRKPVQVTLFPSDGCNLRCRYCYAAAAGRRHTLSAAAARAAVDYIADNAKELGTGILWSAFTATASLSPISPSSGRSAPIPTR
jgi:hypothetical protein